MSLSFYLQIVQLILQTPRNMRPQRNELNFFAGFVVRPPGLKPGTPRVEAACSIQLSYGRMFLERLQGLKPWTCRIGAGCSIH